MPKITSNTICKNGMPFIGKVLEQVEPYMEEMIIHLSAKSNDGTRKVLQDLAEKYPKIKLFEENVAIPAQLTEIRNRQVKMTKSDWILFLDDDDYWPKDQFELCLNELDKDPNVLSYSVNPYQLVDFENEDMSWKGKKYFAKFLRREGLRYIFPWPRDLPADKDNVPLYWKTHPQAKTLPYRFYHLALMKDHSFRSEEWAKKFVYPQRKLLKLKEPLKI